MRDDIEAATVIIRNAKREVGHLTGLRAISRTPEYMVDRTGGKRFNAPGSIAEGNRHGGPHKNTREIERRLKQEARKAAKANG